MPRTYPTKNSAAKRTTQKLKPIIKLEPREYIVTAYAEPASGPGWANAPLWVIIADGASNKTRTACIQPAQQTAEMHALYAFSSLAHDRMKRAVEQVTARAKAT